MLNHQQPGGYPGPLTPSPAAMNKPLDLSLKRCRSKIQQQFTQTRAITLRLFEGIDSHTFQSQAHADFSPVGWHLGHIGFTEGLWLLEHSAGQPPLFPHYRRLFAADGLPKSERQNLPTLDEIYDYLSQIRHQIWTYLEMAPIDRQKWLWLWLVQHESQHCETIAWVLQLHKLKYFGPEPPHPLSTCVTLPQDREQKQVGKGYKPIILHRCDPKAEMVRIDRGRFQRGNSGIAALDNEKPEHAHSLETYWIDRYPVTQGEYRCFIEAGGYINSHWWTPEGWDWLQQYAVTQPCYWMLSGHEDHPVCGVSWYEAAAYARFVGKRLPTEAEWEKAASWNPELGCRQPYPWGKIKLTSQHCNYGGHVGSSTPVNQYPQGQSFYGCFDMLGNVWEWTDTWFHPYEGFVSYPYPGYSQVYFDHQHRVLKGGSWATQAPVLRCTFRNWYHPGTQQHFAGFRCAYS